MAPRPDLTGFDVRKLARLSAKGVKDPWARAYEKSLLYPSCNFPLGYYSKLIDDGSVIQRGMAIHWSVHKI